MWIQTSLLLGCLLSTVIAWKFPTFTLTKVSTYPQLQWKSKSASMGSMLRHPLFMSSEDKPAAKTSNDGIEPKYIIALVVFLMACVVDKLTMHGGF